MEAVSSLILFEKTLANWPDRLMNKRPSAFYSSCKFFNELFYLPIKALGKVVIVTKKLKGRLLIIIMRPKAS